MAGKTAYRPEPGNEAPAVNESELPVTLKISIPQDVYAEYEKAATAQGLTVAELVAHKLRRCRDHNSLRPLYFTDSQRGALETLIQKRPIETAEQALALLTSTLSIQAVSGFPPIQLSPQQIKRINMGGYAGQTAEERLAQIVKGAISKGYGI